jgi:hypothetical protein
MVNVTIYTMHGSYGLWVWDYLGYLRMTLDDYSPDLMVQQGACQEIAQIMSTQVDKAGGRFMIQMYPSVSKAMNVWNDDDDTFTLW